jgi:hypothetical protein
LPNPLVVKVMDSSGASVPGVTVTWASTAGGGSVSTSTSTTNANGQASVTATLGAVTGSNTFTAAVAGLSGSPVSFVATGIAGAAASIALVSGNNQTAVAGAALAAPLVVRVADANGNPISGATVTWATTAGGGHVSAATSTTDSTGQASVIATTGTTAGSNTFTAAIAGLTGSPVSFSATGTGLVYVDPPAGGKIRLVRDASSTGTRVVLNLVANTTLTGYYLGFNLPLDSTKVHLSAAAPFTPGTALPAGSAPAAAKAVLSTTGPLAGVLVTGQSQKAAGAGSVPSDTTVSAAAIFYTVRLDAVGGASPGVVFDGSAPGSRFGAGMRNKAGTDVAVSTDFAMGKLTLY